MADAIDGKSVKSLHPHQVAETLDNSYPALPSQKKADNGSSIANADIIPQNKKISLKERLEHLKKEYDVERFLKDREDIKAKDIKYGKKLVQKGEIRTFNKGEGYEREFIPALYEKNWNADFLTTMQDVKNIRKGKLDEKTLAKLEDDLAQTRANPDYDGQYDLNSGPVDDLPDDFVIPFSLGEKKKASNFDIKEDIKLANNFLGKQNAKWVNIVDGAKFNKEMSQKGVKGFFDAKNKKIIIF